MDKSVLHMPNHVCYHFAGGTEDERWIHDRRSGWPSSQLRHPCSCSDSVWYMLQGRCNLNSCAKRNSKPYPRIRHHTTISCMVMPCMTEATSLFWTCSMEAMSQPRIPNATTDFTISFSEVYHYARDYLQNPISRLESIF